MMWPSFIANVRKQNFLFTNPSIVIGEANDCFQVILFCYSYLFQGLAESECPSDWIIRGNYCYHYHDVTYATSGMSWNESRLACQRYGGDLVVIKNQDEQNFLTANMTQSQKRQHYWIGLSDQASEGKKFWG